MGAYTGSAIGKPDACWSYDIARRTEPPGSGHTVQIDAEFGVGRGSDRGIGVETQSTRLTAAMGGSDLIGWCTWNGSERDLRGVD
jgi:hypothetical protein